MSDEYRRRLTWLVQERQGYHRQGSGTNRALGAHHDRVGLAGEIAVRERYGVPLDVDEMCRRPGGDKGRDIGLIVAGRRRFVDVKTSRSQVLYVENQKIAYVWGYVLCGYDDETWKAWPVGWASALDVLAYGTRTSEVKRGLDGREHKMDSFVLKIGQGLQEIEKLDSLISGWFPLKDRS